MLLEVFWATKYIPFRPVYSGVEPVEIEDGELAGEEYERKKEYAKMIILERLRTEHPDRIIDIHDVRLADEAENFPR